MLFQSVLIIRFSFSIFIKIANSAKEENVLQHAVENHVAQLLRDGGQNGRTEKLHPQADARPNPDPRKLLERGAYFDINFDEVFYL